MKEHTNRLINESSPYLRQHAHNPVDWYPWGDEALQKAKEEDRPIILSIGYSSCHWCHVMERESFEKMDIATLMNNHFVCIKLDREERPDIDQIYMDALQSMGIAGGWPLNVFLTPGQEPFYGGTYFPPQRWAHLLVNIAQAFREQRQQLEDSAQKFKDALNHSVVKRYRLEASDDEFQADLLVQAVEKLSEQYDHNQGGMNKAPKFPLWHQIAASDLSKHKAHLKLTLDQMAGGGIYDQIAGGFARYSVDERWFAPHFEKMLYDNGQLLSLYAKAYCQFKAPRYREIVYQTIGFLKRELMNEKGAFYAALDADSEGEEGKFYTWPHQEFSDIVGDDGDFLMQFWGLTEEGNFEHGRNILYRVNSSLVNYANDNGLDPEWAQNTMEKYQQLLLEQRGLRIRPGLDDKIICGWNALTISGLCHAYQAFAEPEFLELALTCAHYLDQNLRDGQQLWRTEQKIPAFLEDYAALIQAYIALFETSGQERWIYHAQNLMSFAQDHFWDKEEDLFYYTSSADTALIARKKELFDNVIPASNSIMALNLIKLGIILDRDSYRNQAQTMVKRVAPLIAGDPAYLSQWAIALSFLQKPVAEIVVMGEAPQPIQQALAQHCHPQRIIMWSDKVSDLPLMQDRMPESGTLIYVCYNKVCQLPTSEVEDAIKLLKGSH